MLLKIYEATLRGERITGKQMCGSRADKFLWSRLFEGLHKYIDSRKSKGGGYCFILPQDNPR